MERLVRRGARSLADYDALLRALGFEDAARAAMSELLRLDIADDTAAAQLRAEAAAKAKIKGVTLEQFRRAVLLGHKTVEEFGTFLVGQGYTSEAQLVLLAELRRDVADAEAARRRREKADAASAVATLPLSRVTQAARLGLLTPDQYQARLVDAGFSDDDIAIEMELLLVEIADIQAARARRDALAETLDPPKALSLATLERAVKAGVASVDDYIAAASAVYAPADVELLTNLLIAELMAKAPPGAGGG